MFKIGACEFLVIAVEHLNSSQRLLQEEALQIFIPSRRRNVLLKADFVRRALACETISKLAADFLAEQPNEQPPICRKDKRAP